LPEAHKFKHNSVILSFINKSRRTVFFQAFVYLIAADITIPIAKRAGLGWILGYLISDIIKGLLDQGMMVPVSSK